MTKQEEIREGLTRELARQRVDLTWESHKGAYQGDVSTLLNYLHSQGVVIKTEVVGEYPKTFVKCDDGYYNLLVAVEPLLEEVGNALES